MRDAERRLGVSNGAGRYWWRQAGGMDLLRASKGTRGVACPRDRTREGGPGRRISYDERVTIMRGLDRGHSYATIAQELGRDRTVIWREVRRNRNADGDYHAGMAHARACRKAKRPKAFKLNNTGLCAAIEGWMDDGWSPKLIADMLARAHPDDRLGRVSHETIYQCLYVQGRGQLRADLNKCLSTKRTAR
ncbi:helix-turn-helix domain-containing protein, partial [Mycolicibacterium fortuitum]|uniref:helix-turn-helix domain-containing protein n=1 Tax=Mycolicibacterium fortuitum TaxID=1766 RepID=UPI0013F4FA92